MHILVVDDHPIFLAGVEFLLNTHHADCTISSAADAVQALAALQQTPTDLVILDLNLPGIDGAGVLEAMAQSGHRVPTLTMSAESDGARILEALQKGALGFIPKSFKPQQMLHAINEVCAGRVYISVSVSAEIDRAKKVLKRDKNEPNANGGVTPRQMAVLRLVAKGFSNKEIATQLNLTEYTVKSHMRGLFSALDCKNRTACVRQAQAMGILAGVDVMSGSLSKA